MSKRLSRAATEALSLASVQADKASVPPELELVKELQAALSALIAAKRATRRTIQDGRRYSRAVEKLLKRLLARSPSEAEMRAVVDSGESL